MKLKRIIAIMLLVFLAFNALIGGWLLIIDPSGDKIQIPIELLQDTPFNNYLIPGILLFVFIGLLSVVGTILSLRRSKDYTSIIILQAVILIAWLSIEILLNPKFFSPHLHYPLYGIALLLLFLGFNLKFGEIKEA
jgi:hypothetical protein